MTREKLIQLAFDQGKKDYGTTICCPFTEKYLQEAWLRGYQEVKNERKRERNEKVKRF